MPIFEGTGNLPQQTFQQWNDPQGNKLIALNRDGTINAVGVTFPGPVAGTQVTLTGTAVPAIQASMQFVNTNVGHAITSTAVLTTLYAVSLYLDALGDGGPSDKLSVSLTWTQPSTSVVHTITILLDGNTDNVQMETYPILAKAGTPITLTATFTANPFHYDISARLVEMP